MQKGESGSGSGAFVAVDKGLAFGEVIGISGGNAEQIGSAIVVDILPLGNGRFNKPKVTNSLASTISPDHLLMHLQGKLNRKEERRLGAHFANFCKAVP
jgi:hypothetical protein